MQENGLLVLLRTTMFEDVVREDEASLVRQYLPIEMVIMEVRCQKVHRLIGSPQQLGYISLRVILPIVHY